jgi:hypothetical protein
VGWRRWSGARRSAAEKGAPQAEEGTVEGRWAASVEGRWGARGPVGDRERGDRQATARQPDGEVESVVDAPRGVGIRSSRN